MEKVIPGQQKDEFMAQLDAIMQCLETLYPVPESGAIAEYVCQSYSEIH